MNPSKSFQWQDHSGGSSYSYLCETCVTYSYVRRLTDYQASGASATYSSTGSNSEGSYSGGSSADCVDESDSYFYNKSLSSSSGGSTYGDGQAVFKEYGCPESYYFFANSCLKFVPLKLNRYDAKQVCSLSANGWLANLNNHEKMQVIPYFGVDERVYFGLYKTAECQTNNCEGKYSWDSCISPGCVAPVGNYTLNMNRYP